MYAWAEPLYERALKVRQLRFGSEHPAVVTSPEQPGLPVPVSGLYASAQRYFDDALTIAERVSALRARWSGPLSAIWPFSPTSRA